MPNNAEYQDIVVHGSLTFLHADGSRTVIDATGSHVVPAPPAPPPPAPKPAPLPTFADKPSPIPDRQPAGPWWLSKPTDH